MGSFGYLHGKAFIAADKQKEFTANALKLLKYGGMMQFEEVSMFGKKVHLLKQLDENEEDGIVFHYNYFEDDTWESAVYYPKKCGFCSAKKGGMEFSDVIMALYILYELYSENVCLATEDGEIVNAKPYIGWINFILDADFTLRHRFNLWENAELYALERVDCREPFSMNDLQRLVSKSSFVYAGGTELEDLLLIIEGSADVTEENVVEGSYPEDVLKCKDALAEWLGDSEDEEKLEELVDFLKKSIIDRQKLACDKGEIKLMAELSLYMPARVFLYLFAELTKAEFWSIWAKYGKDVYKDARMRDYASEQLTEMRHKGRNLPVEKYRTEEFLRQDGRLLFYHTPEELKEKGNYYLSDDDMLYWWDGSDKVHISPQMDEWLKELSQLHKQIMNEDSLGVGKNLEWMLGIMKDVENYYQRVFMFQDSFYEFLQNLYQKEYIAAIELFRRIATDEKNREYGKYIEKIGTWACGNRNITHNPGRLQLKRYLSVLANKELRKRYLGF